MARTIEGMIDEKGKLKIFGKVALPKSRRVVITILDEEPSDEIGDTALLSEPGGVGMNPHAEKERTPKRPRTGGAALSLQLSLYQNQVSSP